MSKIGKDYINLLIWTYIIYMRSWFIRSLKHYTFHISEIHYKRAVKLIIKKLLEMRRV